MFNTSNFQTTTHALGGGEWSIEVTLEGVFVKEFVGNNGTQTEETDDLWREFRDWVSSLPDDPSSNETDFESFPASKPTCRNRR